MSARMEKNNRIFHHIQSVWRAPNDPKQETKSCAKHTWIIQYYIDNGIQQQKGNSAVNIILCLIKLTATYTRNSSVKTEVWKQSSSKFSNNLQATTKVRTMAQFSRRQNTRQLSNS